MKRKDLANEMLVEALAHYFVFETFFDLALDEQKEEEKNIDDVDDITNEVLGAFNRAIFQKEENDYILLQNKAMKRANKIIGAKIYNVK